MPFIITGTGPSGFLSVTRSSPVSAIALAMKWHEEGVQDVRISPPGQEARCFRVLQGQHFGALLPASVKGQDPLPPR